MPADTMAESRDRLWRPHEVRAESTDMLWRPYEIWGGPLARRSQSITGSGGISIFYTPFWLGALRGGSGRNPRRSYQRGRGIVGPDLPSWYPRKPLRDITALVQAIERRRARLREREGLQIDSPITQDQNVLVHSEPASCAQIELDLPKKLLIVTRPKAGELDGLTPQKKLLNCIEVVREEFQKLKGTPSAKKAERQKKVHNLMSMR